MPDRYHGVIDRIGIGSASPNYLINNGYGKVEIVNLFSFRSKDQSGLVNRNKTYEKHNIEFIRNALTNSQLIIVGWGRDAEKNSKYTTTITETKIELKKYSDKVMCFKDKKGNINCHLSIGYSEEWELVEYKI